MWGIALRWLLSLGIIGGIYEAGRIPPADDSGITPGDDDGWIVGTPLEPDPSSTFWNFGPWKTRREDEWIIGGVLLFIILQSKFWK